MAASITAGHPPIPGTPAEAPLTLAGPPPQNLGTRDMFGLWANLGISLLLPVAAAYVVLPGQPLAVTALAIVTGAVIGAVLLGLTAAPAARERVPAMVLLRGLLGRRASYLPTVLNIVQCVGWATLEIVIIAEAGSRALSAPRWPFVIGAGLLATVMAVRPLRAMRVLARYVVWAAAAATVYLYIRVLGHPLQPVRQGGAASFWSAVDVVIALPVSWFPLAGDYTRHARSPRSAFLGSALGYGASTVVMFLLGALALAAYGNDGLDVIGALLAVPVGVLAVLVLVALELDEAFANIYSTAVSTQNIVARLDRRLLAVIVGAVSTVLALVVDITSYQAFLFLIGAVFVPLAGVLIVAYYGTPRGMWDVSDTAAARMLLLVPWVLGFVAYQLTLPTHFEGAGAGWSSWWAARQGDLGIPAGNGWSASLVSLAVAALLTAAVTLPRARRRAGGR
ncbi:MAG TPA: cytosine permease [Catenuloplanes sp.]|jgi:putative hydroxymethylpyrimidine transporter CytX